ncbi:uncharacterized protein B0T15DRAFT_402100 [Chaetomium strumarium]|uniref:MARVEL domain-containing protein n=1 Tax=Chaetomium strumarium TaxID=1170767 RepID=A0AAJ0LZ48_9PEZI|nr:hypothetical protein B0T15DRAFT_402100 [Chaetomium strumarium]
MGSVSKVFSVILRLGELVGGVIVLALLGRFLYIVGEANVYADSRIIYTTVVSCIAIALSILFMPPFTCSFMAFPIDFILFTLFLVAFCLLETLTGTDTCNAVWYWSYWGYLWGGFWRTPVVVTGPGDIGWAGCASWRTVLAFTFLSSMAFLFSSVLVGTFLFTCSHCPGELRLTQGRACALS